MHAFAASCVGQVRSENQDRFVCDSRGVLAVIDGIGKWDGGGDCAEHVRRALESIPPQARLPRVLVRMDTEVRQKAAYTKRKMGCVATVCRMVADDKLELAHVGDTRAYVFCRSSSSLYQVSTDHTVVQETAIKIGLTRREIDEFHATGMVKRPTYNVHLTPEDKALLSCRHLITRSIGGNRSLRVSDIQHSILNVGHGDILLICSDGLTDMVDDSTIAQRLALIEHPEDLETVTNHLIELANANGGKDNITALLALL